MLVGLTSDLHADLSGGHRHDEAGVSVRTRDFESAIRQVVDGLVAAQCRLVLVGGDIFHTPRPPERSRQFIIAEMRRLADGLAADALVVILEGNHDVTMSFTDRTAIETCALAWGPKIRIVAGFTPQRIRHGDVSIYAIPWMPTHAAFLAAVEAAQPDPDAATNILLLHAGMADLSEYATIPPQTLTRDFIEGVVDRGFDLVACGHYHTHKVIADLRWVSIGSPERASIGDLAEAKGYLTFDTDMGEMGDVAKVARRRKGGRVARAVRRAEATTIPGLRFHPIKARPWYDVPVIDASGRDGTWILEQLEGLAAGIPDWSQALVRVRIHHLAPDVHATLDRDAMRGILGRAFAYDDSDIRVDDPELGEVSEDDPDATPRFEDLGGEFSRFAPIALAGRDEATIERVTRECLAALGEEAPEPLGVVAAA